MASRHVIFDAALKQWIKVVMVPLMSKRKEKRAEREKRRKERRERRRQGRETEEDGRRRQRVTWTISRPRDDAPLRLLV